MKQILHCENKMRNKHKYFERKRLLGNLYRMLPKKENNGKKTKHK